MGAVRYRKEVMLIYPADVGSAFVRYGLETKDCRFLDAARRLDCGTMVIAGGSRGA